MELTGNSANRWEQVSNKIGDIAFETDKQREQLEKLITELVDLAGRIRFNQETLTKLSGVVYKEVFREESKMLNDDSDESSTTLVSLTQTPNATSDARGADRSSKQNKTPKKQVKSTNCHEKQEQSTTTEEKQLPLLKDEQSHE